MTQPEELRQAPDNDAGLLLSEQPAAEMLLPDWPPVEYGPYPEEIQHPEAGLRAAVGQRLFQAGAGVTLLLTGAGIGGETVASFITNQPDHTATVKAPSAQPDSTSVKINGRAFNIQIPADNPPDVKAGSGGSDPVAPPQPDTMPAPTQPDPKSEPAPAPAAPAAPAPAPTTTPTPPASPNPNNCQPAASAASGSGTSSSGDKPGSGPSSTWATINEHPGTNKHNKHTVTGPETETTDPTTCQPAGQQPTSSPGGSTTSPSGSSGSETPGGTPAAGSPPATAHSPEPTPTPTSTPEPTPTAAPKPKPKPTSEPTPTPKPKPKTTPAPAGPAAWQTVNEAPSQPASPPAASQPGPQQNPQIESGTPIPPPPPPPAAPAPPASETGPDLSTPAGRQLYIEQQFLGAGYSKIAVAGIIGNLSVESCSSFDPEIEQGCYDGTALTPGQGYGIAQWTTAGGQQALAAFSSTHGLLYYSLDGQVQFLIADTNQGPNNLEEQLNAATSPQQAADILEKRYERAYNGGDLPEREARAAADYQQIAAMAFHKVKKSTNGQLSAMIIHNPATPTSPEEFMLFRIDNNYEKGARARS